MSKREKGQRGEALAAAALIKAGYTILTRNWRCNAGEIDLIAEHKGDIVFVEVRARFDGIDIAIESITPSKQRKLQKLAQLYLKEQSLENKPYRIDVVAVGLQPSQPLIEIIENAVGW